MHVIISCSESLGNKLGKKGSKARETANAVIQVLRSDGLGLQSLLSGSTVVGRCLKHSQSLPSTQNIRITRPFTAWRGYGCVKRIKNSTKTVSGCILKIMCLPYVFDLNIIKT